MRGIILWSCCCILCAFKSPTPQSSSKPNFIIIFTDDQGHGDLGCFGGEHVDTPHLDTMAAQGMKLTSFYVAAPICTPSRAALMTGSYPKRIHMSDRVLLAGDHRGLHPNELTIAEVLKTQGYATGIMGKWHLGDQPEFLPTRQGFDAFFGLPYSHDIHPWHQNNKKFNFPDLPLLEGEEVIEMNPDMNHLTQRITDRAVEFIERNKDQPFFLYLPHPLPHRPVYASPEQMHQAADSLETMLAQENGTVNYPLRDYLYPQAIGTIDDSVGEIMKALSANGLDENTLVIFTSDNGPARGGQGSTGGLRGRKGDTYEGGMREPAIAWWPGKIPSGSVSDEILTAMDLLPTFAKLAGATVPPDRVIDGKDIWAVLSENAASPHQQFYYYHHNQLQAVRSGEWKYHERGGECMLFNLKDDRGETNNVIGQHPAISQKLKASFDAIENELGEGSEFSDQCRPAGYLEMAGPLGN
ncbi:arylsulfatase [Echinicola strongylocentroti]|uniref:Arylsulfatase n=1 Tax=Echinicola strongylocentroti TaxID=1795355 RepID=A0A2Z4INP4_9BACT|nr:sulfatase [Echinicola strongylocentroti]AWW32722.1 arylsulfatase [Echinicola strongylocentroti]